MSIDPAMMPGTGAGFALDALAVSDRFRPVQLHLPR
jgi:hypothetical protein